MTTTPKMEEVEMVEAVYSLLPTDGAFRRDTFDNLSADYDFASMDEVEAILSLKVGEEYADGYAIWKRES